VKGREKLSSRSLQFKFTIPGGRSAGQAQKGKEDFNWPGTRGAIATRERTLPRYEDSLIYIGKEERGGKRVKKKGRAAGTVIQMEKENLKSKRGFQETT